VGFDATTRKLCSGDGADSALSLSDDVLTVQPVNDDTTGAMLVKNKGGSNILAVDTVNSRVLCGSSQINALTQYAYFSATQFDPNEGIHRGIPFQSSNSFGATDSLIEISFGSGTNPDTSFDVSASVVDSDIILPTYWYIVDAITIIGVHIVVGGGVASVTNDINFHLMKYDFDTSGGTGDLSGGVVVADQGASGTIADVHEDAIKYESLSVDTSNNTVTAGQVVICTLESTGVAEISCTVTVKFNIN